MKWIIPIIFTSLLYSDFTITYRIDNKIIQSTYYKDSNHTLFKLKENNKTLQKLLISDDKRYIEFTENGKNKLIEIPKKGLSNANKQPQKVSFNLIKIEENGGYSFKTQKWIIKKGDKNETLIVSDDKKVVDKVNKMVSALKSLLPSSKASNADIFNISSKYAIIKSKKIEFLSLNDTKIDDSLFAINNSQKIKKIKESIDKCSLNICCGKTDNKEESKELSNYLQDGNEWKLINVKRCIYSNNNYSENAIFTNDKEYLSVILKDSNSSGEIGNLQQKGINIIDIQIEDLNNYKIKTAYIPQLDRTIEDIIYPDKTITIISQGDVDIDSIKETVLKNNFKYSSNN